MTKTQRYRYEMFVRVRDFGSSHRALFPESLAAGKAFADVATAITAVDEHLSKRDLARAEALKVKAGTRSALLDYMKRVAHTGREVNKVGPGTPELFRIPARRSNAALLARARMFIVQAQPHEAQFVHLGLPSTFLSELQSLVNDLTQAVTVRLNGRTERRKGQAGVAHALDAGFDVIETLDVAVANALRLDPVRLAAWHAARRQDGSNPAHDVEKTPVEPTPATTDQSKAS